MNLVLASTLQATEIPLNRIIGTPIEVAGFTGMQEHTIASNSGKHCLTAKAHTNRAFLETTNAITFTDEDMEVQHPDHSRPLYVTARINDVHIRRALVNTSASLNLVLASTLQATEIPLNRITSTPIEVVGFTGMQEHTIASDSGTHCLTTEAHTSRAVLETTNAITFTDEDMEVQHPDHSRPLYVTARINNVHIRRALVDTGASLNLVLASTLQATEIPLNQITGTPIEVAGFTGMQKHTIGSIQLVLRVGPIVALTRFHVIDSAIPYHALLGRPWLHIHKLVPSTYHQCVKGRFLGKPIRILANHTPFDLSEAHYFEADFYNEFTPCGEDAMSKPIGTPLPD